ncbi:MAG TPA: DUF5069 domain-containing protein [Chthoniobacteraceae bacterium]|nr:DUF5069 domain-containing protein [Chthoniobacteraceae bacterium]
MSTITISAKDLTKEAPRSPRIRLGGYVILGRTTDKCRAFLAGTIGEYHFDCPLDNQLFGFKGITGDDFKHEVEKGLSDDELVAWVDSHGASKTPNEIKAWSDQVENYSLISDPEKKDFFIDECKKVGIDPYKSSLFDWLEADDKASFKK